MSSLPAVVAARVDAALAAVDPRTRTRAIVKQWLGQGLRAAPTIIAYGKAAQAMTLGARDAVPDAHGLVYAPASFELPAFKVLVGGHPFASTRAEQDGRRALDLATSLGEEHQVIALVSGGGSSLFEVPRISIDELRRATKMLMQAGATIQELNACRVGLSEVKAGRLAAALAPAEIFTAILNDVPGGELYEVASGPTLAHTATSAPVRLQELCPDIAALWRAPPSVVPRSVVAVVGDNELARDALAALEPARPLRIGDLLGGEAREAGAAFLRAALGTAHGLVTGGETTVTVSGTGRGGRNQEFVLGAFELFEREAPEGALLCAFGTDGIDGQSPNAGAFLDHAVIGRARSLGLDPYAALENNDSATFFEASGGAIVTGPTGTNVADLAFTLL